MKSEEQERETIVTIGIAVFALLFLMALIGIQGVMGFISQRFMLVTANAFLIVTLIQIAKSADKKRYGDYATFIIIGVIFMAVYMILYHQTVITVVTNSLEYVVAVLVIAGMVNYLKREL